MSLEKRIKSLLKVFKFCHECFFTFTYVLDYNSLINILLRLATRKVAVQKHTKSDGSTATSG